jgi:hypothetical protein
MFAMFRFRPGILISIIILLAAMTCVAQKRTSTLSARDKAQIVKSILLDYEFFDLERDADGRMVIPLSSQNISPKLLPKLKAYKVDLFSPSEIKERTKTGFRYLAFGKFKSKRSIISVTFGDYFFNTSAQTQYSNGLGYEFRKVKGKWIGKQVSGWGSISESFSKKGRSRATSLVFSGAE